MAFNINEFVTGGLKFGGARPTLFNVVITFPSNIAGVSVEAIERIQFLCRASSVPASSIASVPVPYFGRQVKVAGDRTFSDWSVTIMNDEDYVVRNAFEAWHNSINSIISNRRADNTSGESAVDGSGYKGTAYVQQYSKNGDIIKQYRFDNIFPVNVDEMGLDWDATNTIQTFGVTFAYDWWIPITEANQLVNNPTIPVEL